MEIGGKLNILIVFGVGVLADIFFLTYSMDVASDIRLLFLCALWLIASRIYKFKSIATAKIALGLLVVMFILFLFNRMGTAIERASVFFYIFLTIGVVQQFFELRRE